MQIIPLEQIEHKLQEIAQHKSSVVVRIPLFGGVELCHVGELTMGFDQDDACPFFTVIPQQQYATNLRFYGTDVRQIRRTPKLAAIEIILGVPQNMVDNLNDLP